MGNYGSYADPILSLLSLHFTAATHNGVTNYHATQGNQTLPTSEADFVSDLSQGKWATKIQILIVGAHQRSYSIYQLPSLKYKDQSLKLWL